MNQIYIGHDSRESVCFDVCEFSILQHTKQPVTINPIKLSNLSFYNRKLDPLASTEFTYSRFLTPYLQEFKGWALFCDCDFLFLEDVSLLFNLKNEKYAVMVCKHDYKPSASFKMDGKTQSLYPKKKLEQLDFMEL